MSVESVIVARLLATSGVTDLIASRIRPFELRQADGLGGIAYTTISEVPVGRMTGDNNTFRTRMQLDCFAASYNDAKQIQAAVVAALDGYAAGDTDPEITSVRLETASDLPTEHTPGADKRRSYGVSLDFIIWHGSD